MDLESTAAAIAVILGAVGLLAGQLAAVILTMRQRTTLTAVQHSVNGHQEAMVARIDQLTAALKREGDDVPAPPPRSA